MAKYDVIIYMLTPGKSPDVQVRDYPKSAIMSRKLLQEKANELAEGWSEELDSAWVVFVEIWDGVEDVQMSVSAVYQGQLEDDN